MNFFISVCSVLPPCSDHMQELITNEKNTKGASDPTNLDEGESQFHDTYLDNQFECSPNENPNNPSDNQSDEFHDILGENQFNIPNENQSDAIPIENQFHNDTSENLHRDSPIEQFRSLHPSPLVRNSSATCLFSASPNNESTAARNSSTPVALQLDASQEEIIPVNENVLRPSPQRENNVPSPQCDNMLQGMCFFLFKLVP
jgi:hypothetical protein